MSVRVRDARESDLEALVDIHWFAFPDSRGHDARVRNFRAKPLGGLSRLRVAYDPNDGDRLVGHAFLLDLGLYVGGRVVRTGGVATLGVLPAARGRGVASALLHGLHEEARRDGMALTMLYAFRQRFYARAGYSLVSPSQRLELVPASLREVRDALRVRHAAEGDRAAIALSYARACANSTGMIARPETRWDELFTDERLAYVLAVSATGGVVGAVGYRFTQSVPHGRVSLEVEDLFAESDLARASLFSHLRALRDQVASIAVSLAWDDPLPHALLDADADRFGDARVEHAMGRVCAGPMLQIMSARELLARRGYAEDGDVTIAIALENEPRACFRVVVRDGAADVLDADLADADVVLTQSAASVLAGGVALGDASRLGFAQAKDELTLRRADGLLATHAFLSYDEF